MQILPLFGAVLSSSQVDLVGPSQYLVAALLKSLVHLDLSPAHRSQPMNGPKSNRFQTMLLGALGRSTSSHSFAGGGVFVRQKGRRIQVRRMVRDVMAPNSVAETW